jgi:hypothetical protein
MKLHIVHIKYTNSIYFNTAKNAKKFIKQLYLKDLENWKQEREELDALGLEYDKKLKFIKFDSWKALVAINLETVKVKNSVKKEDVKKYSKFVFS